VDGSPLPETTFNAWYELIVGAQEDIHIAAYKSSLRGKHVFGKGIDAPSFSLQVTSD
jgi:hypothetical protein